MTFDEYQALKGYLNWSLLKEAQKSMLHFRWRLANPLASTPAMDLGRAAHCAVLEPDRFFTDFAYFDGPRRAGKAWEEFAAVNVGRTILKPDDYEKVLAMRDAVFSHKIARRLLRGGKSEVSLKWTDEVTRMRLKARLDHVRGDTLVDFKTTRDLEERVFSRLAVKLGYISQLAMYRMGLIANGHDEGPVYMIAVESEGPFDVAVYELDDEALYAGEEIVRELLQKVKDYRRWTKPPGRYPYLKTLEVPPWFFDDGKDQELILTGLKAREG